MPLSRRDEQNHASSPGPGQSASCRHSLREQDLLWADFLALAASVVNSLEKSVQAICDGRFDLISEVENEEEDSDRREVLIELECLRILALYEPVASDLRRMATVLKGNRDWERIADLALRVAQRARKLSRHPGAMAMPEPLKQLARDVLSQVRASYRALASRDPAAARTVIAGDTAIDARYRALRKQFKDGLGQHPEQLDAWLELMNTARNLERIADHAVGIAQTVVYLEEGVIIRHTPAPRSADG
ncbi:MAG: phosphate signaling complex protein PhoU [Planctomycetaceae bacterium]|nr:phosphate signaling complex protein PhoU [Planctomycetaceae bacterium]